MKLKVARIAGADSFNVVAQDVLRTDGVNGELRTYSVRIPVRQADVIGAYTPPGGCPRDGGAGYGSLSVSGDVAPSSSASIGSSDSLKIPISAVLEHDADNDGYGDETQDQCPTSGATAGPCPLPTVLGQTFTPSTSRLTGDTIKTAELGVIVAAQEDGVITSWSYQANSIVDGTLKFKMFRPLGGNDYRAVGADQPRVPVANVLNTFQARIPVRQGDKIGVHTEDLPVSSNVTSPANSTASFAGDLADGDSATFAATTCCGRHTDISAVLEADADGDGYGDTSQDACPTDASTQGECPVAVLPPPTGEPPLVPDTSACDAAHESLDKAKAKLKKLKHSDAPEKRIDRAKEKVKKAKDRVKEAC
jgi:hypothetical protein